MIGRSTGRRRRNSIAGAAPFSDSRVAVRPSPLVSLLPTFGLLIFAIALAWGLFGLRLFRGDGDVGRHLRIGRDILAAGRIPTSDAYSHTMDGMPFVPYEWLSEVAFATADAAAGLAGVAVLSALLLAATTWVAYRVGALEGAGPLLASTAAGLSLILQSAHFLPRPHLFTTLLAVVCLWILESVRSGRGPRRLYALPALTWAWANLHGGFLVGFVLLGVYLVDAWRPDSPSIELRRPLVVVTVTCVIASLLTPAGLVLWAHTTGYLGIDFLVDRTAEYRSPDFHALSGRVLLGALAVGILLLATGRAGATFVETALFLGWLAAALHSGRNIPLFGVLAVPWYPAWAKRALASFSDLNRAGRIARKVERLDARLRDTEALLRPGGIGALLVAGMLVVALSPGRDRYRFDPIFFPVDALREVEQGGPRPNVFNDMAWGGYLLYERPDIPVFMDGQTDFYGESLAREYVGVMSGGPEWRKILHRHSVGWTLTPPDVPLVPLLTAVGGWTEMYRDSVAVVMVRTDDLDSGPR